mmetsp:Transcript_10279/g.20166  ORF Transcript_10279/g.20166 Transcript_10279/m.20166 type:complete len:300 (+) Transcript_10279:331-1230(+)
MSKWGRRKKKVPAGFADVEPTLTALEDELRQRMEDPVEGKSKAETLWPVHQINWQKSRYIYQLYYKYHRISEEVYKYCIDQGLVDKALIAKWKKPGYERLCSTYVINTANYPYGTTSVCRVPLSQRKATEIRDNVTGCRGCASGVEGHSNIFGNKYGQNLAKIQVLRERYLEAEAAAASTSSNSRAAALDEIAHNKTAWATDNQSKVLKLDGDEDDIDEDERNVVEEDEDTANDSKKRKKESDDVKSDESSGAKISETQESQGDETAAAPQKKKARADKVSDDDSDSGSETGSGEEESD